MGIISNTIVVVLGLKVTPVSAVIVRSNAIVTAMAENSKTFPSPTPALSLATSDINALGTAETATKTRASGTVATRDDALKVVIADMKQLHTYVQQIVNATPAQADVIAQQAAMTIRKTSARHKSDLAVSHVVSGIVKVVAKAVAGARAHEWQYSTDGKTWTNVAASLKASTTISGLQPGVLTYFRQRPITKDGPGDWSQAVSAMIA